MNSFKGKSVLHKNAISLVIKGEKTMQFAEQTVFANDRSFHFLSAGNCLASIDLSRQDLFRSILIFFDDKVLTDFYLKYGEVINDFKSRNHITVQPYVSIAKDEFVHQYIASLELMLKSNQQISKQMKNLKLEELLLYLLEKYPLSLLSFQTKKQTDFDDLQMRMIVETHAMDNLTVEELAFLCNTSLSTFKRRFAKIYNSTPNKWLLQRRMETAANLLKNHGEKPAEVFHKLGYDNHSSFTKSFKQVYGVTPKEFQLQSLNV